MRSSGFPRAGHRHAIGSLTTNNTGGEFARQSYFPYGSIRAVSGLMPTKIAFTGQYTDDTGLMFFQARYMSPVLGRFISADTIVPGAENPQAFNRYSYVVGNPLRYTDPSGHDVDCAIGESECRKQAKLEKRNKVMVDNFQLAWDQLRKEDKKILSEGGWTEDWWNAENVDGSADDPGLLDPALLIPIGGGIKVGAIIIEEMAISVGAWCLTNPVCAGIVGSGSQVTHSGGEGVIDALTQGNPGAESGGTTSPYGFPQDPTQAPSPGFEWRGTGQPGSSQGNWFNPSTDEYLHWDTTHHGVPHWDYRAPDGTEYWIWPNGGMTPKP